MTSTPPQISVIIPTHNGARLLSECLEALWAQTFQDFEIVVVDDASTDNTPEMLLGYPEVRKLIRLPSPGARGGGNGFVSAVNAGYAEAVGEIIVLLNNDATPENSWLAELVGALQRNPWAGMAASRLMLYSKPDHFHSAGDYYGLDGAPNSRGVWQSDTGQYDQEEEVFGPCAAAAAYRREVLEDVAGCGGTNPPYRLLDPQLWMYCEDVDFNLRARLRGHRTVYAPTARVLHRLSATGGGKLSSYYVGRNFIYLLAKDIPGRIIRRNLRGIALAQLRFIWEALRNIRQPASRARLKGIMVGFVTWPRVMSTRKRVLSTSRISPAQFERMLRRFSADGRQ